MRGLLGVTFLLLHLSIVAQNLTQGPVFGALTEHSAKVYVRFGNVGSIKAEVSTDSTFAGGFLTFFGAVSAESDYGVVLNINNLQPNTRYFIRFAYNLKQQNVIGSFKTLPEPGQRTKLTFLSGSTQITDNPLIFNAMEQHQPDLFLHLGGFTFPADMLKDGFDYPTSPESVNLSWLLRYSMPGMNKFLRNTPMVYLPDEEDSWGNAKESSVYASTTYEEGTMVNFFVKDSVTPAMRQNVLKGYQQHFPGYDLKKPEESFYHSFKAGNTEFFVLDTRSYANSLDKKFSFNINTQTWSYNPPENITCLGQEQLAWLKEGLARSTADWKFIVMSVPFNKSYQELVDVGMLYQQMEVELSGKDATGFLLATMAANYFASNKAEHDALTQFLESDNVNNVIILSGDTYYNEIDDGSNSGVPELNSGGLSVVSTELAYRIDQFFLTQGLPSLQEFLWNKGGNGLGNRNFENSFGKIEVFGIDSVCLSVIDEYNNIVASHTIKHNTGRVTGIQANENIPVKAYPNPAKNFVLIDAGDVNASPSEWSIFDATGRLVAGASSIRSQFNGLIYIDLSGLPTGMYHFRGQFNNKSVQGSFVKS